MYKVFIDGSEGTTGLRIFERFEKRDDIELIKISSELRKDPDERRRMFERADIAFLCLPDVAAIESVELAKDAQVKLIDTSTAHRTAEGWAYGFPELSAEHRKAIVEGNRIAVPGCHASGFQAIVYPLIKSGIISNDYPLAATSITGYSGGGKKMIAEYEAEDRIAELASPRLYGLTQEHKHLKEMKFVCGLKNPPMFMPYVADYYSGMLVTVPLIREYMKTALSVEKLREFYKEYYNGNLMLRVSEADGSFMGSNNLTGIDDMEIFVQGNDDRITVSARFDNLGKGASGAAIQCMNLMLGVEENKTLNI